MPKLALIAAVLVAALYGVREERVLERAHLLSSCHEVARAGAADAGWLACRAGRFDGYPDLTTDSCTYSAQHGELQLWACPAALSSGRAPADAREP